MFDSLKEKLGSFREDVEEQAEVEEIDEDEVDENEADEEQAGAEANGNVPEGEAESDEIAESSAEGDESAVEADETTAEEHEETIEGDDDDAESDENRSGGFARKAKSFARGRLVIEEDDLEDPLWELEMALLESDVELSVAEEIMDGIQEELVGETRKFTERTGGLVENALREALLSVIDVGQFDFDARIAEAEKPIVIIFTGVNGVGKTTSIAKLSHYLETQGYSSVIANGDTYRAGANEQIREHAENLGTKLIAHEQGGDPTAVIYDAAEYAEAHDIDVVLGDTAGRLHTSEGLMDQLAKIDRVVGPDTVLFVDEAVAGQDAVRRAREFNEAAEFDGAILTKADADSKGGAAISIAHVTGKPILFLGVGQGYDDLERFDPEEMVERLVGEE